ncbi:MAG: hypothetical protein N2C12_13985 [Planctomycetales bacterium]
MSRFQFEIATAADDDGLRCVLAATPMPGPVRVRFCREPSYFAAAVVDGQWRQVIVCRDSQTQKIVGFGTRSIREMYVNGAVRSVGYLSNLRLLPSYRSQGLVARGYRYFRELHEDGRANLYLTTIAAGNQRALSLLTAGRANLPGYHCLGNYHTLAIPLANCRSTSPVPDCNLEIRSARKDDLNSIVEFLNDHGPRRQFFPCYDAGNFFHDHSTFRNLQPADILLAFRDGQLVGTLGGWDQHPFRQTVVDGYEQGMRWKRPFYNAWAMVCGRPCLPQPGTAFRYLVASIPLVAQDDPQILHALLGRLSVLKQQGPCQHLLFGVHDSDPLLPHLKLLAAEDYLTHAYLVCWEDGEAVREHLDDRPPYMELGCL